MSPTGSDKQMSFDRMLERQIGGAGGGGTEDQGGADAFGARLARRLARLARARSREIERIRNGFVVDASDRGVVAIRPGRAAETQGATARRLSEQGREELVQYLDGERTYFSVPVDLDRLPEFQRTVLHEAQRIPFGQVRSYSFLAERISRPLAARAVGTALGRNPVPFIVPCHRVLRGDASLGGYAFGLPMKIDLLALESATPVLLGCDTTRIVCRVGCAALRRARPEHRVGFASVADAVSVGYRACRLCRPAAV